MKVKILSEHNSFSKNIVLSLTSSMVWAYGFMCMYWIFSGMKYSVLICFLLYLRLFSIFSAGMVMISTVMYIQRRQRFGRIISHSEEYGYDDEYYDMLLSYMGGLDNGRKVILYAGCLIEGKRYAQSRRVLEKADFKALSADDQNEYFNICLYSAVMEGKAELANEIYAKAKPYFDRATVKAHSGNILHTLGMLCYINGRYENAQKLFESARAEKSKSLRCECDIGICKCKLKTGEISVAKELCYIIAREVTSRTQAETLRDLMQTIEVCSRTG